MPQDRWKALHRRRFLESLGIGMSVGVAGCLGDDDTAPTDDDADDADDAGDDDAADDEPSGPPEPSGAYHTANGAQFETLNPIYNNESGAGTAIDRTLDQGYTFTPDGEVFPLLYDMSSDDGSVWVFEIREGLEFSDPYGEVDAESFVYQIQELHQSEWAATSNQIEWTGVEVTQTGPLEFQAEIPDPDPLWPATFDPLEYPIPKGLIEPYVEEEDREGLQQDEELLELSFTGNLGPYVLTEWERGAGTTYVRNEDYYLRDVEGFENTPYFEEASIQVIPEEASRLGALETGEINSAGIPPARVEEFEELESVDVYSIPQPYNRPIALNMRDNGWNAGPGNLFQEKEFRQAMAIAINKQDMIDGIYRGRAEPHFTWQPEWSRWYPDDDDIPKFGAGDLYGPEPAQEKVEEALENVDEDYGYDGGTLLTPDGEPVVLEILYYDISPTNRLIAEFHAQELSENLGIEVEAKTIDGILFSTEYWQAEPDEAGASDTINGREVVWDAPSPTNPGPRDVTSENAWDMAVVFGLNTYPRHPGANEAFFDDATAFYNPVGWYPSFDAARIWSDIRSAETEAEIGAAFEELFIELAYDQPYIMTTFADDIQGYTAGLEGPIENFSNGWDFPAWHIPS